MEVNEQQVYEALGVEQPAQEQPAQEQAPQETQQPQAQPPQGEMSLEQRRENAARRRRAETRAAIQEAVEAERTHTRRDVEQVLRDAALRSPVDGTPITNLEQYRAFKEAQQAQPAPRPQADPAMEAQVASELAQIRQLNPNIRSVGDLLTMPRAKEFYQLVKRGNSFVDACSRRRPPAGPEPGTQQGPPHRRRPAGQRGRHRARPGDGPVPGLQPPGQ